MIYGERIRLRAGERSDMPCWVEWLNDPEVTAGLDLVYPLSMAAEEGWFDAMLKRPPEEHVRVIEVQQGASWQMIGNCSYFNLDWRSRSAELGIFIGEKSLWNQGYGADVMRLLLQFGFETMNLHRIWLRVFQSNHRAIRCYEKAGFIHEGRYRQARFINGGYEDVLIMSVLKPEYDARK